MKISAVIGVVLFVICVFVLPPREKKIKVVKPDEQLFAYLEELSQDSGKRAEHIGIIEKLCHIVQEEAKKAPQAYSSFIEEIVQLVPKAGPGVAILVEDYADEAVKNEMQRLRKESHVAHLCEIEKIMNELARENTRLTAELSKYRKFEVDLSSERVKKFIMVRNFKNGYFARQLHWVDLWDDVRQWPEKTMKNKSAQRYQPNKETCYFNQCSAEGILPIEFEASNRDFGFVRVNGFWNKEKPLQYLPVMISIPGQPNMFMPVVQLTGDGLAYMKGWILKEELE